MVTISGLCSHSQKSSENCIYALSSTRTKQVAPERPLQTRSTFIKSVMVWLVSMGLCQWFRIDLIFISARVEINDVYYLYEHLTQKLLSVMREICGMFFLFQQDNVPAHRARGTINLLKQDTCVYFTRFLATQQHRSEPDWLQKYGRMQQVHDVDQLKQRLIDVWHRFKQMFCISCLLILWTLSQCMLQIFSPISFFYISQGSAATHLRCGGQCDMGFVANFLENTTVEGF